MRDRTDSPWYPTLRLFRQTSFNDWTNVVTEIKAALEEVALHQAGKLETEERDLKGLPAEKQPGQQEIVSLLDIFNRGRHAQAVPLAQAMTESFPRYGFGWKILGAALKQLGQNEDALAAMQRAVELAPGDSQSHNNLGTLLKDMGRLEEAESSFRSATRINHEYAEAHNNLGIVLYEQGRIEEAEAYFLSAIRVRPDYAEAHNNLGITRKDLGRDEEAEASFRSAIRIRPDYAEAHNNLGNIYYELGRIAEAEASCLRALEIRPDLAEAHSNLGIILGKLGRLVDAEASFRRALEIREDNALTHCNLGFILNKLGRMNEAEASFRRALEIKPDYAEAYSNLLFCLNHSEAADAQALFAEHLRFAEIIETPLKAHWLPHANAKIPERILQVGFVSADLRTHPVVGFIEPVLAHLARSPRLSLHVYNNYVVEDSVTRRLREGLPHWHHVARMSDLALAGKIRADGIDILIDLSGHTGNNRLPCFARKPAPVQVTWIGYPGTTGLSAMDYYLADRAFLPPGQFDSHFTEKIVYLPAPVAFLPDQEAPPVNRLPALSNGYITFGSFNRPSKIGRPVIALWSQLLRALPDARMVIGAMFGAGETQALIEWFTEEGIALERLDFFQRCPMKEYFALYHRVDICLDPFPFNGSSTTADALWMGAPTMTLAGDSVPGRAGVAWLNHFGLDAFVAHDKAEFIRHGLYWSGHLAELAEIREGLRARIMQSASCRPVVIATALESALRTMWQRWCAGLPAESFEVPRHAWDG
jgi:predicted O-linked N-acetylglucosamine transferase (SPINDLY family)